MCYCQSLVNKPVLRQLILPVITNTLAYYETELITPVKRFIVQARDLIDEARLVSEIAFDTFCSRDGHLFKNLFNETKNEKWLRNCNSASN